MKIRGFLWLSSFVFSLSVAGSTEDPVSDEIRSRGAALQKREADIIRVESGLEREFLEAEQARALRLEQTRSENTAQSRIVRENFLAILRHDRQIVRGDVLENYEYLQRIGRPCISRLWPFRPWAGRPWVEVAHDVEGEINRLNEIGLHIAPPTESITEIETENARLRDNLRIIQDRIRQIREEPCHQRGIRYVSVFCGRSYELAASCFTSYVAPCSMLCVALCAVLCAKSWSYLKSWL